MRGRGGGRVLLTGHATGMQVDSKYGVPTKARTMPGGGLEYFGLGVRWEKGVRVPWKGGLEYVRKGVS